MVTALQSTVPSTAPLGQKSPYPKGYDRNLLQPIARAMQRTAMKLPPTIRFFGYDVWNAYELFWLNPKGKPVRAYASMVVSSSSPFLCESKSVKLYLNSLNHERFATSNEVQAIIAHDLSTFCQSHVQVTLAPRDLASANFTMDLAYRCLDDLDVAISTYERAPDFITVGDRVVNDHKVVSHLFKSHCLCTGQPDLGSIFIEYSGAHIDEEGLLAYLVSYRDHVGFSENCIEQIFADITDRARPKKLLVFGRFTRRGGIDINPYRSNDDNIPVYNARLVYQ